MSSRRPVAREKLGRLKSLPLDYPLPFYHLSQQHDKYLLVMGVKQLWPLTWIEETHVGGVTKAVWVDDGVRGVH